LIATTGLIYTPIRPDQLFPSLDPSNITALKAVQLTNDYVALNHGDPELAKKCIGGRAENN